MSQSSILFGALFIGFLVYVTMRGELSQYGAAFMGTSSGGLGDVTNIMGGSGIGDMTGMLSGVMDGGGDMDMSSMMGMAAMAAAFA